MFLDVIRSVLSKRRQLFSSRVAFCLDTRPTFGLPVPSWLMHLKYPSRKLRCTTSFSTSFLYSSYLNIVSGITRVSVSFRACHNVCCIRNIQFMNYGTVASRGDLRMNEHPDNFLVHSKLMVLCISEVKLTDREKAWST